MKNKILLLLILMILGCSKKEDHFLIELSKETDKNIAFDPLYSTLLFSTLKTYYPTYYDFQLETFRINPDDSIIISTLNTDHKKFKYELYINGFVDSSEYKNLKIDSLIERRKPSQYQLVAAVSFEDSLQILRIDENGNKNFSDDRKAYFKRDFNLDSLGSQVINELPVYKFNFWNKSSDTIIYFQRNVNIYPDPYNRRFFHARDSVESVSRLAARFKDYWLGNFKYEQQNYEIAVQGANSKYASIFIKHDSLSYSENNFHYNKNFQFKVQDTILLNNDLFKLENLSYDMSSLSLVRLHDSLGGFFSDKIGYTLKDFNIMTLDEKPIKISEITNDYNDYILLDFWGTWCKPCIEQIPTLKAFHQKNKNVSIIGVAFDNKADIVKDYVSNNNLNWPQTFVSRRDREENIVKNLSISDFPTYILLDKNLRIIHRGVGESAFLEISKIIMND
jgi:thiol-disulfide isomerase/thioredoxin